MTTAPHLTDQQLDEIAERLDAIRDEIVADLGADDAAYIRRMIAVQRGLETSARAILFASLFPPAWLAGTSMLAAAKVLENMELGHNIMHGQWDWMRDPNIHSTTWEWDNVIPAKEWKASHNAMHHMWTNVIGKDDDVGYSILRVTDKQEWQPHHLVQVPITVGICLFFEYGIALYDAKMAVNPGGNGLTRRLRRIPAMLDKVRPQAFKDYVAWPLLTGPSAVTTLTANVTANIMRNMWTHTIIFCGHFPDGVEQFTEEQIDGESRGAWYVRQMQGSANIEGSPLFHIMSGNLSHQIEHHCFPDIPSNRYAEIAPKLRALCDEYDLPYTTGPLGQQIGQVWLTLARLSLPSTPVIGADRAQTQPKASEAA